MKWDLQQHNHGSGEGEAVEKKQDYPLADGYKGQAYF